MLSGPAAPVYESSFRCNNRRRRLRKRIEPLEERTLTLAPVRPWSATWAFVATVVVARYFLVPLSPWFAEEFVFVASLASFDTLPELIRSTAHPFALLAGKFLTSIAGDAFDALAALSLVSSAAAFAALVAAFRSLSGDRFIPLAAALLFVFSPAMLVWSVAALPDAMALALVALAIAFSLRSGLRDAFFSGFLAAAVVATAFHFIFAAAALLVVAVAVSRSARWSAAAVAGAAAGVAAWLALLVAGGGIDRLSTALSAAIPSGSATTQSAVDAAVRFAVDPWGPLWLSVPTLLLAAAGVPLAWRRAGRRLLPLAAIFVVQLVAGIVFTDPASSGRFMLVAMIPIAFLAACGAAALAGMRAARATPMAAAILSGFLLFSWPLLAERTGSPSPSMRASSYASNHLPAGAAILFAPGLPLSTGVLFEEFELLSLDGGLRKYFEDGDAVVWQFAPGNGAGREGQLFSVSAAARPPFDLLAPGSASVSLAPVAFEQRFFPISGIHPPSSENGARSIRWLSPRAKMLLAAHSGGLLLLALQLPADAPLERNRVTVLADGSPVGSLDLVRGEVAGAELPIASSGRVRLEIVSSDAFVPQTSFARKPAEPRAVQLVGLHWSGREVDAPVVSKGDDQLPFVLGDR